MSDAHLAVTQTIYGLQAYTKLNLLLINETIVIANFGMFLYFQPIGFIFMEFLYTSLEKETRNSFSKEFLTLHGIE